MSCAHESRQSHSILKSRLSEHPKGIIAHVLLILLMSNVLVAFIFLPQPSTGAPIVGDRMEPVVVSGIDIPNFLGMATDELWVYAYISGGWVQIPFQIDERNDVNGSYFYNSEDGNLDLNDEIVFMPFDCGYEAPETSRVPNTDSERYKILITDPLDSSEKYVYIFTSSVIAKTFSDDYADYYQVPESIVTPDYEIGFNESNPGIIDKLCVSTQSGGDSSDVLDRFKYRFQKTIEILPEQFNENDFTFHKIGVKDGAVRVIYRMTREFTTNDFTIRLDDTFIGYKSYLDIFHEMNSNTSTDWVEVTVDFLNSSTPLTYYDANSNQFTVDGSPDPLSITDAPTWYEVTGTFGTIVAVCNYSQIGVTPSLIYTDDWNTDDPPEFENGLHGKHGLSIPNPSAGYKIDYSYYILPSNQGNIGGNYLNLSQGPLVMNPMWEVIDPSAPPEITLVQASPDPQEVKKPVNISALVTDNLNEVLSVYVQVMEPHGAELGNYSMIFNEVSGGHYFEQVYTVIGTYEYTIWAVDYNDNWESYHGEFHLIDTTHPELSDINTHPAQKGVGANVNISGIIIDSVSVEGAWIRVENPAGELVGNFSMDYDPNEDRYFFNRIYDAVGIHSFLIFANDTSDNWNHSQGQFEILDTLAPTADAGSHVNINTGTIVQFNGTGSMDNVGILNYSWTFTDVTPITLFGPMPSFRFENTGNFRVTLNTTDAKWNWDVDTVWVNVTEIVTTGSISGLVTNSNGNPIAGASVMLKGTSFSATTDGTGYYLIENVPADNYDITVNRENYKDKEVSNVLVMAGQTTSNVQVTMSKEQSSSTDDSGGIMWLLLVIVLVVIVLVIFLIARPKKETEIVEVVTEELSYLCPECGYMVNHDMERCPECGVEFKGARKEEKKDAEEDINDGSTEIYMCPSCGSFLSLHASSCERCGFVFDEDGEHEKKKDDEVQIPATFIRKRSVRSKDKDSDTKREYDGVNIPSDLKDRVVKEVEDIINENDFELEETELSLEVELDGDLTSEEKKNEAKEIIDLFKEELKIQDTEDDLEVLSKEIDDLIEDSQKPMKKDFIKSPKDEN